MLLYNNRWICLLPFARKPDPRRVSKQVSREPPQAWLFGLVRWLGFGLGHALDRAGAYASWGNRTAEKLQKGTSVLATQKLRAKTTPKRSEMALKIGIAQTKVPFCSFFALS